MTWLSSAGSAGLSAGDGLRIGLALGDRARHAAVGVRDGTNAPCALRDCGFRGVATATEGPGITVESGVEDGEAATAAAAPGPAQEPAPQEIAV